MFMRVVSIDGFVIHVPCTPETPYWEVLERAVKRMREEYPHDDR